MVPITLELLAVEEGKAETVDDVDIIIGLEFDSAIPIL